MVKKIKLDFSKVEERAGWNTKQMPEGLYKAKIASVEETEAQDGTAMLVFALVPADDRYKARRFPHYCKLQQNQLWKLRDLFVAAGVPVPKKAVTLDPNQVVGKYIAIEIGDGTGQYADRSEVNGTYGLDVLDEDGSAGDTEPDEDEEYEGDEDESEEEGEEEEEAEDEEEEADLDDMTLPELRALAKEYGIKTVKKSKDDLIEELTEALAEDEDDEESEDEDELDDEDLGDEDLEDEEFEEDEEEEEEKPSPKKRATPARKPAAKAAAPAKRTVRRR